MPKKIITDARFVAAIALTYLTMVGSTQALTMPSSEDILSHALHQTRSVLISKIARFFSFTVEQKAAYTQGIANALLKQTVALEQTGNLAAAKISEQNYEHESKLLTEYIDSLQKSTHTAENKKALNELTTDRTVELRVLEHEVEQAELPDLHQQFVDRRSSVLKEVTNILEDVPSTDQAGLVQQLSDTFATATLDRSGHLADQLEFTGLVSLTSTDDKLKTQLEAADNVAISNQLPTTPQELKDLVEQLDHSTDIQRRLNNLLKINDLVPAASQAELTSAIDRVAKQLIEKNPDQALEKAIKETERSADLRQKVLEQLKEHADEPTKQLIEQLQKQNEQQREDAKQANEQLKQAQEKADEAAKHANEKTTEQKTQKTETSNSSQESNSTSSDTTSSTESQHETIEIEVKNGAYDGNTSFSVKTGTILTVKFKVDDDTTTRTLTLSNGQSGQASPKSETSLSSFSFNAPLTFSVSGVAGSGTITIIN